MNQPIVYSCRHTMYVAGRYTVCMPQIPRTLKHAANLENSHMDSEVEIETVLHETFMNFLRNRKFEKTIDKLKKFVRISTKYIFPKLPKFRLRSENPDFANHYENV